VDSGGPNESCIRWVSDSPVGRGNFDGEFVRLLRPLVITKNAVIR